MSKKSLLLAASAMFLFGAMPAAFAEPGATRAEIANQRAAERRGDGGQNRGEWRGQRNENQNRGEWRGRGGDNQNRGEWRGRGGDDNRQAAPPRGNGDRAAGQQWRHRDAGAPQQGFRGGDDRRFDNNNARRGPPAQAFRDDNNRNRYDGDRRRFDNDRRGPAPNFRNEPRRYDHNAWRRWDYGAHRPPNYSDRRRAYAAVPYGGYFGPSYGVVLNRYYGRSYVYYGARSWPSWRRPWRVGYALPPSLYCRPLPYDLYYELEPPPYGYEYALCDGDILLVDTSSSIVVDALIY